MHNTTYIHEQLHYFFSSSEHIDISIGGNLAKTMSLSVCLDTLEQSKFSKNALLDAGLAAMAHLLILAPDKKDEQDRAIRISDNSRQQKQSILESEDYDNEFVENNLHKKTGKDSIRTSSNYSGNKNHISSMVYHRLSFNQQKSQFFFNNDGLKISLFAFKNYVNILKNSNTTATITDEMIIKTLINLFYLGLMYWHTKGYNNSSIKEQKNKQQIVKQLQQFLIQTECDNFMISLVSLTLEVHYLPIKKLVMLYTRVLSILFNRPYLYSDQELLKMCTDNLLNEDFLRLYKQSNPPSKQFAKRFTSPIQKFYAIHNMGDCPLAQSIVVGLLRSLLTICNSQAHGKFASYSDNPNKKGANGGADSYRQWQITYQFLIQQHINQMNLSNSNRGNEKNVAKNKYIDFLSEIDKIQLQNYEQYNSNPNNIKNPCHYEFYSHKVYTTSSIAVFLSFLLLSLKTNNFIQYSYLFQLISDANGILVFLKFLTDKFENLSLYNVFECKLQGDQDDEESDNFERQSIEITEQFIKQQQQRFKNRSISKSNKGLSPQIVAKQCGRRMFSEPIYRNDKTKMQEKYLKLENQVMLSVYSVLVILYGACNNYAEKTRSYLFQYNSYLIIKKIPHIFMQTHKNDDELPSKEELERQFIEFQEKQVQKKEKNSLIQSNRIIKVRELTELCYDLLKIQIPFFSKKMKESANNMRMIVDIYCQLPKKTTPIVRSEFDKILLKSKFKKVQAEKYIRSVQELKIAHNQYNNLYYWANEETQRQKVDKKGQEKDSNHNQAYLEMSRQKMQEWLQQNVWRYYD